MTFFSFVLKILSLLKTENRLKLAVNLNLADVFWCFFCLYNINEREEKLGFLQFQQLLDEEGQ